MNRNHYASILSMLLFASCASAVLAQQTPEQVLVERARLLDAQGRHQLAAENWRQVLLLEPKQRESLTALANYYRTTGDKTKAQYYDRMLGSKHSASGDKPESSGERGADAKLNEAARLSAEHKYTEALATYQEVFGSTPPETWAIAYYQTEAAIPTENAKGISGLRSLTAKYPANPKYQLALAEQLTYRPSTRAEGLRMLSAFRGNDSENDRARAAWRAAILWDPTSAAALVSSKQYLQRYPDDELEARIKSSAAPSEPKAEASPEESAGYRALASGDLTEAASHFNALTRETNLATRGELGLGYVSMRQTDFETAVTHFENARTKGMRSASLDKALKEARYWSAMSAGNEALQSKDVTAAASEFARAREVDSHRPEAAEALGGSMIAAREPQQAEDLFASHVKSHPERPEAWIGWMNALLESSKFDRVLDIQKSVPSGVRAQLVQRPDYLAILLSAELAQGNSAESRMLRDRLAKVSSGAGGAEADVQAARVLFRYSNFEDASRLALAAVNHDTKNAEAWQVLIQSEHMGGRDHNAMTMIGRMPSSVSTAAMSNAEFVLELASIYQSEGQLENAKVLLDRAEKISSGNPARLTPLEMQKAALAQAQGNSQLAYQVYRRITRNSPDQLDAWIGMLSALHAGNHDSEALSAMHDIPEPVSSKLRHDLNFLETAGFIYNATGHHHEALLCLRAVTDHYEQQRKPMPFGAGIELAWLQLNMGDQRQLAAMLDRLGKLRGLSLAQTIAIQKVWAAWSMRRAEAAFNTGNSSQALTILQAAAKAYPGDAQLCVQLAGMYVRTGRAGFALKIFQGMDWNNASVDQFTSGINAAIATHSMSDARYWLYLGLEKYPGNTALLRAGAHVEERKGDLKAAEKYLNLAAASEPSDLPAIQKESAAPASVASSGETTENSAASELARVLESSNASTPSADNSSSELTDATARSGADSSFMTEGQSSPVRYQQDALTVGDSSNHIQSGVYYSDRQADLVRVGVGSSSAKVVSGSKATWQVDENDLSDNGSSTDVQANHKVGSEHGVAIADPLHGGDLGLLNDAAREEKRSSKTDAANVSLAELLDSASEEQEESISGNDSNELVSALLGNAAPRPDGFSASVSASSRFTAFPDPAMIRNASAVITRPVMLQSGVPDSTSNYRFGSGSTLPADTQFASGTEGSLQLATHDLQASIGFSPSGFLVNNVLGNLSIRPLSGPFTFSAYRASQKDSLLSYAGLKDPDTGQVWGGVVATGGSLQFARGGAASGFYASIDGQKLTGVNVAENTRVMGNAGAYWLAYSNPYGDLKIGANLTAMHYAMNQRYFTIGQGGYFSPDAFLLMNAPITWQGRPIHNTTYMIGGSVGAQSIQESAALPGSLIAGTGVGTTAGASYDLHLKLAHSMDAHWTLEGFLDTNNARQYTDTTTGFTVRYSTRAQTGDMRGSGFLNIMEPLPLQVP